MCMKCEIRKMLGEVLGVEEKGIVGTISVQLRADFKAYKTAEALAEVDLDMEVLKARRAFLLGEITKAEVEVRQEAVNAQQAANRKKFKAEHKALWNRVHEELPALDPDTNYSLDHETGEVKGPKRRSEEGAANVH